MHTQQLGKSDMAVSKIGLGCMRMAEKTEKEASRIIENALELGINFFDHADIYGAGKSEEIFARAIDMNPTIREKMIIQSKAGIREGQFDFSKEYIVDSVDKILQRLKTEYLDVFLLHRPDALMEPDEVAEAFQQLKDTGKVREFGVSNQNSAQIQLLQKSVQQKLHVNQLQFSLMHSSMIDAGLYVNMTDDRGTVRDGSILDYCRLHDITIQAWSPFMYGNWEGLFIDDERFPKLNAVLAQLGEKYSVAKSAIAIAWILRHPAQIQPIVGTMTPSRLTEIAKAAEVVLTREDWYALYIAAGNELP